jgi:hypothetical protein
VGFAFCCSRDLYGREMWDASVTLMWGQAKTPVTRCLKPASAPKPENDRESLAHPTRFERVTFAFGGRFFEFATICGRLQACKKPLFRSGFLMDDVARFC